MWGRRGSARTAAIGFVEAAGSGLGGPSLSFSWICQIPAEVWSPVIRGVRWVEMPRLAFAMKCGLPNDGRIGVAFRTWARHQQRDFALAWDLPLDPISKIRIVERTNAAPAGSRRPGECCAN